MGTRHPYLQGVALDTTDARALAEFYRELLGFEYRSGDEPPESGQPDPKGKDWLVLVDPSGRSNLAFQQVAELPHSSWPDPAVPQQLHLDFSVESTEELAAQHQRIMAMGGRLLQDRFEDPQEPLYVYADPSGHPFCVFVGPLPPKAGADS
jgi:catechol 2,3-dioxygenase-like lactoylglutathione lyase family enzyme